MILYHGSNIEIYHPDLSKSRPYKDFGKGFYLSADKEQALRMAERAVYTTKSGVPTITSYLFDESLMSSRELNVKIFNDYTKEWAEFVCNNRNENIDYQHDFDIVYGPIADDGVTFQLRRYLRGAISIQELIKELQYSQGITFQYYFGTLRALSKLKLYEID